MLIHLASDEILIDSIFSVLGIYLFLVAEEELCCFPPPPLVFNKMFNSDSSGINTLCSMRNDSKIFFSIPISHLPSAIY